MKLNGKMGQILKKKIYYNDLNKEGGKFCILFQKIIIVFRIQIVFKMKYYLMEKKY